MAFRERLVKTNVSLKNTIKDLKNMGNLVDNTFIINNSEKQQKLIEKQINDTDRQLELTLKEDGQIHKHFDLINSVVGIGLITAVAFLIYTQNLTLLLTAGNLHVTQE